MTAQPIKKYKNQVEENEAPRIARNASTPLRKGAIIEEIAPGSIAQELGISPGSALLEINDAAATDAIQLKLADASENVVITIIDTFGETHRYEIEKDAFEPLGIYINAELYNGVTRCTNKCPFCFVDALPPRIRRDAIHRDSGGADAINTDAINTDAINTDAINRVSTEPQRNLRRTLYVRDDDFRLSFLHGHYITLTNLSDADYARIIEEKLSPLCVSVHATDPATRIKMVGNKTGGDIVQRLEYLIANGITINAQIVLCPGVNDGAILDQSINDLKKLWPGVESLAVVPIGVTKWLPAARKLSSVAPEKAREILDQLIPQQRLCEEEFLSHWVYASDEMYLLAEEEMPPAKWYDGYPQFANGVGVIRSFQEETAVLRRRHKRSANAQLPKITLVTGRLAAPVMRELAGVLQAKNYADANVIEINHTYWGGNVACAGLIMGQEILEQIQPEDCGDFLFLAPDAVDAQNRMLDDITLDELSAKLQTRVRSDANGPLQLAKILSSL